MLNKLASIAFIILMSARALFADSPRTALVSAPILEGRAVSRLRLLSSLVVNDSTFGVEVRDSIEVRIPPGSFMPVSEDKDGVFFQSTKNVFRIKFPGPVSGGIYITKNKRNRMVAYVGDARVGSRFGVKKARFDLTWDQRRYFQTEYLEGRNN